MIRLSTAVKNSLLLNQVQNFGVKKVHRPKNAYQRIKRCANNPYFKLKTLIRPPDLTAPDITFPIKIPIRYRHFRTVKKQLFVDDSRKIHWNRLQPNEILLGLEHVEYLSFNELVEGLEYLSKVETQDQHNWNEHEWVSRALNTVRDKFDHIKKKDVMKFYWLMKKLQYKDETFWKKLYAKIEENIYDLRDNYFEYFFLEYYDRLEEVFSANSRENFHKLMAGQIRQYKPESILRIFDIYHKENRLDNYWLENVFITLFKSHLYAYNADQIGRIFRYMMIIGHEENERLYTSLYGRILKIEYQNEQEVEDLIQVLEEVKQIFTSHRVESSLEYLENMKKQIANREVHTKKTLEQMVKDDLRYFIEKRKLKQENAKAEAV